MAYTDHSISGYVQPQDAGWSGVAAETSDWANAAFIGGLALANGKNYAPEGLSITPSYTNDTIQIGSGLAYIEDNTDLLFREYTDSEQQLSGTWSQPFLTASLLDQTSALPMEAPSGVNHVWYYYTHSSQNDLHIRISDSSGDTPADPSLKLASVDASAEEVTLENREGGGGGGGGDAAWTYLGTDGSGGADVSQITASFPDNGFDQYKVEFVDVGGTSTASGSGSVLYTTFNGIQQSYHYRTVGNTNAGASNIKTAQGKASRMSMGGHLLLDTVSGVLSFDNRTTGNEEKQMAFSGSLHDAGALPLNSIELKWSNGQVHGDFNFYARNLANKP